VDPTPVCATLDNAFWIGDTRPNHSLTADYARLSRFLLKNAPGSEMSYFAAATHMDEKLPFEQITLAQLLPADKHSLWQS